jgi:hypothetical protein
LRDHPGGRPGDGSVSAQQGAPGPAGRHDRSYGALIGALLVTVLVVVGFVGLRALNRDELEVRPQPVDYSEPVAAAQDAGFTLVYPTRLPDGWIVTNLDFERGEHPAWGMDLLTGDGSFVGLRQEDADVDDLLSTYVDESPSKGETVTLDSAVATSWQAWSDEGGDRAYSARVASVEGGSGQDPGATLLVYGSASAQEQAELIGLLVTEPLEP